MESEDQQTSMNDESKPKPKAEATASGSRIRLRAILLGSGLALVICLITPFNNAYRQGTPLGGGHFPLAGVLVPDGIAFRDRLDRFGTHIFY